jgi:hypothetical protein
MGSFSSGRFASALLLYVPLKSQPERLICWYFSTNEKAGSCYFLTNQKMGNVSCVALRALIVLAEKKN